MRRSLILPYFKISVPSRFMPENKKQYSPKPGLHPRNKHKERYDFELLAESCPELKTFVQANAYGNESIDFFNPQAVKMLNKALLSHFYGISSWDIPEGYLCPPIPGRADYIHHIAELISGRTGDSTNIRCLDIGIGANCVYPIIGVSEYGWSFVGSDIDPVSIRSAQQIVDANDGLKGKVELRLQVNPASIFQGIIREGERFDLTICNPPFHASQAEAQAGTVRKLKNLKQQKAVKTVLNFGGQHNELWTAGGEEQFVRNMIAESKQFAHSCRWFSTLISKESNLRGVYKSLEKAGAKTVKTIPMEQGNKTSRIVAWSYFSL